MNYLKQESKELMQDIKSFNKEKLNNHMLEDTFLKSISNLKNHDQDTNIIDSDYEKIEA